MKVLVACEESQRVCQAFRDKGHEAYSADILDCSGGHLEWHIKGDVLKIINPDTNCSPDGTNVWSAIDFDTMDGVHHQINRWDLMICHPPCTYLTVTGNRWFNEEKYGDKARERKKLREEAYNFFLALANADCDKIAIENPIGYMNTHWRKPDQIIQPYWFGEPFEKRTCLWLKGLPNLVAADMVTPEERTQFASGKSMPAWYCEAAKLPPAERSKVRSKTFWGIARAMADQWG